MLDLTMNDSDLKNRFSSYLSRDLRKIPDVDVVDSNATYVIRVVQLSVTSKTSSVRQGYALAVEFAQFYNLTGADKLFSQLTKDAEKTTSESATRLWWEFLDMPDSGSIALNLMALTGADEDAESTCENIATAFDTSALEPERQKLKRLMNYFNSLPKDQRNDGIRPSIQKRKG